MSLQWFEWHTTHERFQGRLHALTKGRNYKFRFDLTNPSGEIEFDKNLVSVNPLAMDKVFEADGLEGKMRDEANYLMTRALTGHEALHALYTDPEDFKAAQSDPDVQMVLNILEDARIENIGAEESYVSEQLFKLYSATVMKMMPEFKDPEMTDPYSWIQLLAYWREGYAIPQIDDEQRKKWIELRNMAEDALYAPTSNDVLHIAHKVVDFLGLGKKNKQPDQSKDQPSSDLGKQLKDMLDKTSSKMSGKSQQRPKENPLDDPRPQKGSGDPQQDDGNQQQPGGGQDDQQDPQDGQGSGDGQDDKQDQSQGNGQGGNQSDQDGDDKGSPKSGGQDDQQGHDDQDMSNGGSNGDDKGDPQQGNSQGQDDGDDQGRNALPDKSLGDVVNNCQASVKDGPEQDVPQGDMKQLLRGAAASDHAAYNNRDIVGRPYMDIYEAARPLADEIKKELKADDPKAVRSSSAYPGRLRMRYYLRDENKPFAKHNAKGKNLPKMALSLIIDRSESMRCRVRELRIMAAAVYLACEELKIPLEIWVLEGQIHLKKWDEWGPHVLAKIAGIQAITWTNMTPTLTSAADSLKKRPEPMKQMVMIHDGGPGDRQNVINFRKGLGHLSLYCLLVVPDIVDPDTHLPRKDDSMDELVGPGNYCIAFMKEVPKFWCSFIKNKREALAA